MSARFSLLERGGGEEQKSRRATRCNTLQHFILKRDSYISLSANYTNTLWQDEVHEHDDLCVVATHFIETRYTRAAHPLPSIIVCKRRRRGGAGFDEEASAHWELRG